MRGQAVCNMHGGMSPNGKAAGAKRLAQAALADAQVTFGLPRDIDPAAALLEEVHRTAGHVAWLQTRIADLNESDLTWGLTSQVDRGSGEFPGTDLTRQAVPPVLLKLYADERKHLVAVCAAAIGAGIEERRVRLAEEQGQIMAGVIRAIFADLDLTPEQAAAAPGIASRHLRLVTA